MKVFLSGGTHGGWQSRVIGDCREFDFYDPRQVKGTEMKDIAAEERGWIDESDIVFVYLEASNPSGLGSAFEMGYAVASRIPIIYVDEKQTSHTEWIGVYTAARVRTLDEGIALLKSFASEPPDPARGHSRPYIEVPPEKIYARLRTNDFAVLTHAPLRRRTVEELSTHLKPDYPLYEALLIATSMQPRRWFDWNVGYLIPHLDSDPVAQAVERYSRSLRRSEGIAWGLGELGSEDERIIDFLYAVCEECADYDAWWCAGQALEKLRAANHVDLLKRTLRGEQWDSLDHCLDHLESRAALIGILRLVKMENLERTVIPRLVAALEDSSRSRVQHAIWLLERLRFDDARVHALLTELFKTAEDAGESLAPRVVEALGEIASADSRLLLEREVGRADYFRTRAYAAKGLGLIGDSRSTGVLEDAFRHERDPRVTPYLTEALYAIGDEQRRRLNDVRRHARWPENGMVVDDTNRWYANPEIYEMFSRAEDPGDIAFGYAASLIPRNRNIVADLGAGTGRMSMYLARTRPDIAEIRAFDADSRMVNFLAERIQREGEADRVSVTGADNARLPLDDQSVDAVVSSWAFPSRMWDADVCLRELHEVERVLKPRGVLVTLGWDETFQDEMSEFWYRYVPEPDFRRETLEQWRRRRRARIESPRNSHLTFVARNLRVPVKFESVEDAAFVIGHLFGFAAGESIIHTRRREFSMLVGITRDVRSALRQSQRVIVEAKAAAGSAINGH